MNELALVDSAPSLSGCDCSISPAEGDPPKDYRASSAGVCLWCKTPIPAFIKTNGLPRKFCCNKHRADYRNAKTKSERANRTKKCLNCGAEFKLVRSQKFCSYKCAVDFHNNKKKLKTTSSISEWKCKECGCGWVFGHRKVGVTQFCSASCKERYYVKTNVEYKLRCRLKANLTHALMRQTARKAAKTETTLGCSITEFRKWLEDRFAHGMSWDNYGYGADKWNLGHVVPCANFDLSDPEQQKQCFSYTNIFPQWQTENQKLGARQVKPRQENP